MSKEKALDILKDIRDGKLFAFGMCNLENAIKELEEDSTLEKHVQKTQWIERFTKYNSDSIDQLEEKMDEIVDRICVLEKNKPKKVCDRCGGTGTMCICHNPDG